MLQENSFTGVSAFAFRDIPAGEARNSMINLGHQRSNDFQLQSNSLNGIVDGSRLTLAGQDLFYLPRYLFGKPSSLRRGYLDLTNLGLYFLEVRGV